MTDKLQTARDRFTKCLEAMEENRKLAEEADEFSAGLDQWPEEIKREREQDQRPCLVMDETNQYINQIKNDQRQNKAAIKVRPVDDKADKKVAEMLQGVIRHIEDTSSADIAYDTAFEHALRGGFGYWRVYTDYCDGMAFEQEIKIGRIRDRFSVYLDPDHQEPDGSDSKYGFVTEWMSREDFKRAYPDADLVSWEKDREYSEWIDDDNVLVADYFYIEETEDKLVQLPDGSTELASNMQGVKLEGAKTRPTTRKKVVWQKINGNDVLEQTDWMGQYIPIIECIGNESEIEGKRRLTGIVHAAIDAQRMHNYAISAMVEHVALAPKAPFVGAAGQIEGYENTWKDANRKNISFLPYHPISSDGVAVPPPQRQPGPALSQGWSEIVMASRMWIQASMGMYNASVGAPSNEKSGKAILARQREGDVSSFHYHDNLARSIRHTGRILVDLIPKIYDTKRVIRILGEDGQPETVMFDPEMKKGYQEAQQLDGSSLQMYNPTVGKYDVSVSVGPSYSTKRQEAAETQMQMVQAAPELMPLVGDIMIRNMDWPGADQIADRLKAMLPPPIKELENKPNENTIEAKAAQIQQAEAMLMQKAQALFQKEQELMQAQQAMQEQGQESAKEQMELEAIKSEMEALKTEISAERRILAAEKAKVSAELKLAVSEAQMSDMETEKEEKAENETMSNEALSSVAQAMMAMIEDNRTIQERMEGVQSAIGEMVSRIKAPRSITYQNGEIDSVGGRKAMYDEQGNLVGLSGLDS